MTRTADPSEHPYMSLAGDCDEIIRVLDRETEWFPGGAGLRIGGLLSATFIPPASTGMQTLGNAAVRAMGYEPGGTDWEFREFVGQLLAVGSQLRGPRRMGTSDGVTRVIESMREKGMRDRMVLLRDSFTRAVETGSNIPVPAAGLPASAAPEAPEAGSREPDTAPAVQPVRLGARIRRRSHLDWDTEAASGAAEDARRTPGQAVPPLTPLESRALERVVPFRSRAAPIANAVLIERASAVHAETLECPRAFVTEVLGDQCLQSSLIDMARIRPDAADIFEVKSLAEDGGNERDQVRAAVAQLLDYRYSYRNTLPFSEAREVRLWCVLSSPPRDTRWTTGYLASIGVRLLWIEENVISGPGLPEFM